MLIPKINIPGLKKIEISPWRLISLSTWKIVGDSSVYGILELPADEVLRYIDAQTRKTGQKITLTHFVGKALAAAMKEVPEINSVIRWGRIYRRPSIDIFFHIAADEAGSDLTGAVLREMDKKPLSDVAKALNTSRDSVRKDGDPNFHRMTKLVPWMPPFFLKRIIDLTSFILFSLNLWTPLLGCARDPFGSAMVTSVGMFGIDFAIAPIAPYTRVPIVVTVGSVQEVLGIDLKVKRMLRLGVTFDHRLIDGIHAAKMARRVRSLFEAPHTIENGTETRA